MTDPKPRPCPRCGTVITKTRLVVTKKFDRHGALKLYESRCTLGYCDPCNAQRLRALRDARKAKEVAL